MEVFPKTPFSERMGFFFPEASYFIKSNAFRNRRSGRKKNNISLEFIKFRKNSDILTRNSMDLGCLDKNCHFFAKTMTYLMF